MIQTWLVFTNVFFLPKFSLKTVLYTKDMLLALPANFRLSWKLSTVTNTLDDYDAELITTVKSFLIQPRAFNLYANE